MENYSEKSKGKAKERVGRKQNAKRSDRQVEQTERTAPVKPKRKKG
jgi:hypothetical protein